VLDQIEQEIETTWRSVSPDLLKVLAAVIKEERGPSLSDAERQRLASYVKGGWEHFYKVHQFEEEFDGLRELHGLLPKVIEILGRPANAPGIIGFVLHDAAWHERIVSGLRLIARSLPKFPPKRRRGRPVETLALDGLVKSLIRCWEELTGHKFERANWHREKGKRGVPANRATAFIHLAVEGRLPEGDIPAVKGLAPERAKQLREVLGGRGQRPRRQRKKRPQRRD
jgi:hypothetical protein